MFLIKQIRLLRLRGLQGFPILLFRLLRFFCVFYLVFQIPLEAQDKFSERGLAMFNHRLRKRPSNQIFIQKNYCSCLDGKPDLLNNCSAFCASHDETVPTLFGQVDISVQLKKTSKLGNLYRWCTKEINDGRTNPNCQLEAWDGSYRTYLDVVISPNSNTFTADLSSLEKDVTYVMTLVETGSGSMARSDSIQVKRIDFEEEEAPIPLPLSASPVHQYLCINPAVDSAGYPLNLKNHYYYISYRPPQTLPPSDGKVFCHDTNRFGEEDSPLFPRLGLTENLFHVWGENDSPMFDQNANGQIDINDQINKKLLKDHGIKSNGVYFVPLNWPDFPGQATGPLPRLGFILRPWNDPTTMKADCPQQRHYNGPAPVLKVLKDIVAVDTEGLYLGQKQPERFIDANGNKTTAPEDFLLIGEGVLKKIWFTLEKGQPTAPREEELGNKTTLFYWPPDVKNPYLKKSTQDVYIIKHPSQLNLSSRADIKGGPIPADKKFGCIPKN